MSIDLKRLPEDEEMLRLFGKDTGRVYIQRVLDALNYYRCSALHREGEIKDLKSWVITFLAPYAVQYSDAHGLDGLYPTHYDMLEKCGARMVEFTRAELPQ
jgi:hypothetical protein